MNRAEILSEVSLNGIRQSPQDGYPLLRVDEWRAGRCSAAAFIEPTVYTVSAENESNFLVSYHQRHKVYKS